MGRTTTRLLVDIDDTLYPAGDLWVDLFRAHVGVDIAIPVRWDFWRAHMRLADFDQLVREHFHAPSRIRANIPFAGAGAALRAWWGRGAEIHIVSDRAPVTARATRAWLREHEIPADRTVCESGVDKIAYALEHGIELVIDDKPTTIERARVAGLLTATIRHPYNLPTLEAHPEVIGAGDWYELRAFVENAVPVLASPTRRRIARRAR